MKLIDIKNEVYEALGVATTAEVKEVYTSSNLARKADWEAILEGLNVVHEALAVTSEPDGFPTTNDESTGENSDRASADVAEDDLEPDLIPPEPNAPMAPVPVALWDFMPGHNLVAVLSPWAHYLEWLERFYANTFALIEFTFWSYENA